MILLLTRQVPKDVRYTRTRGDDPAWPRLIPASLTLYPHTRGWSQNEISKACKLLVIPAHAGMILHFIFHLVNTFRYTRTRGDDPIKEYEFVATLELYPHTRGWS